MNIIIDCIKTEFKCSNNVALQYMKILKADKILEVLKRRSLPNVETTDPEINKLRTAIAKKQKYIKETY